MEGGLELQEAGGVEERGVRWGLERERLVAACLIALQDPAVCGPRRRLTGVELLQVVQDLRQLVAALDVPADEAQRAAGSRCCC